MADENDTPFDMLRQVLEEKGVQAASAAGLPVVLWQENLSPPKDGSLWGTFTHNVERNRKVEAGGGARRGMREVPGLIEFIIYMPEKRGSGALTRMADKLVKAFDCEQFLVPPFGEVTFEPITAIPVNPKKDEGRGYACMSVWGYFRYRYHAGRDT